MMPGFFQLFWTFLKIGLFTFGGGYAMLPLIQREIIGKPGWTVDKEEFVNMLTLAQSVPGPIALNISVAVGYKVRGYAGAVATALGVIVPSFVVILLIAILFADIRHNPFVEAAFKGMRPAVVALILVPVVALAKGMHWTMYGVIAASAFAVWYWSVSPIWLLAVGAAAGITWALLIAKKSAL